MGIRHQKSRSVMELLPHIHTIIGLLKRWLLGYENEDYHLQPISES